jgi:hypothetical protein
MEPHITLKTTCSVHVQQVVTNLEAQSKFAWSSVQAAMPAGPRGQGPTIVEVFMFET